MSNDLNHYQREVHGLDHHGLKIDNDIAPYSPSQPLAPAPSDWGATDVDLLRETKGYTGGGQIVFGQVLPPGVTIEQMTEAFTNLGKVFVSDFLKLGHDISRSQKAASWLINAIANPPQPAAKRHNYNLFEHTNDPTFQAFANYAHDNKFPAKFVQDACWWVTQAAKRLNEQAEISQPRMATPTSGDPLADLSEAEYAQVVKANEAARAATMGYLSHLWGDSFEANLRMVDNYYKSLPLNEQQALDQITTGGISSLNTKEVVLFLYKQAIGYHSLPTGGALASEIAECERVMRTHRKQWLADDRLQSRYRQLLMLRDGH